MEDPASTCAFCGSDEDVERTERLGVLVVVCAACTARFAAGAQPAAPPPSRRPDLPPTLGQQSSAVVQHVRRMAQLVAARPYAEEDCPACGAALHVYPGPDEDGGTVALAKDPVLAAAVPVELRWRVVEGRAVPDVDPADGEADEEEVRGARVRHAEVCGAAPAPANARLHRMWLTSRRGRGGRAGP